MDTAQHILEGHFALMKRLLANQQVALSWVFGLEPPPAESTVAREWPMLGDTVTESPDTLYATRVFSLDTDLFLNEHVFGGSHSDHTHRRFGLPVLPFMFSLELIIEAACRLTAHPPTAHAGVPFAVHDVKARRWLGLDEQKLTVEIEAGRLSLPDGANRVLVQIYETSPSAPNGRYLAFEGTFTNAVEATTVPVAVSTSPLCTTLSVEAFNAQLFHGALFRTLNNVLTIHAAGAELTAVVPVCDGVFRNCPNPTLRTPAVLLDTAGQMVGYWLMEQGLPWFVVPVQLDLYEQRCPPPPSGTTVTLRGNMTHMGDVTTADIDILLPTGATLARFRGLRMQLNPIPLEDLPFVLHDEIGSHLSVPSISSPRGAFSRTMNLKSVSYLTQGQSIWARVLARTNLSEREHAQWLQLRPEHRVLALLQTLVAKEALLDWLGRRSSLRKAAEFEVSFVTHSGRFSGRCLAGLGDVPECTVEHTGSTLVATLIEGSIPNP